MAPPPRAAAPASGGNGNGFDRHRVWNTSFFFCFFFVFFFRVQPIKPTAIGFWFRVDFFIILFFFFEKDFATIFFFVRSFFFFFFIEPICVCVCVCVLRELGGVHCGRRRLRIDRPAAPTSPTADAIAFDFLLKKNTKKNIFFSLPAYAGRNVAAIFHVVVVSLTAKWKRKKKQQKTKKKHDKKNQPTPTVEAALSIDIGGCKVSIEKRRLWLASNDGAETMADHPPTPTHRPTHRPGDQSETSCRPIINHRDNDPDTLSFSLVFFARHWSHFVFCLCLLRSLFWPLRLWWSLLRNTILPAAKNSADPRSIEAAIQEKRKTKTKRRRTELASAVVLDPKLLGFSLPGFTVFLSVEGRYRVLPSFTEFYRVLAA